MISVNQNQKRSIAVATIIALVFSAYFLRNFFVIFCTSVILAYIFWPVKVWLSKRRKQGTAISLTIVISLFSIIIPIFIISFIAFTQLNSLANNVGSFYSNANLSELGQRVVEIINNILGHIPFLHIQITEESLIATLNDFFGTIATAFVNAVKSAATSIISLITSSIIFLFVFASVLRNADSLINNFKMLNPLGNQVSDLYLTKAGAMIKGTVRGQFIIAIIQGFVGALSVALAGSPRLFSILFLILSALSVIPLGGGILLIPVGILMILFGNVAGGLIILGTHFIITTNIDNFLRPVLVPAEARLDPALMLVSVFSGLAMFGFLGIVIGPTIMILVVTTVQVYLEVYKDQHMKKIDNGPKTGLLTKIKNIAKND